MNIKWEETLLNGQKPERRSHPSPSRARLNLSLQSKAVVGNTAIVLVQWIPLKIIDPFYKGSLPNFRHPLTGHGKNRWGWTMQAHILHDKCVLFWQANMELPVKRPSAGMYFKVIILFAHTRISNKHFILSNFECLGKGSVPNAVVEHLQFKSYILFFHRNYAVQFFSFILSVL